MATEWKKLSIRLHPQVHYAIMQLSPNPTRAMRKLLNLWAKKLIEDKYPQGSEPQDFNINFEEIEANDREHE